MRKPLKDYFIPHEGNDYRPHSLERVAMLAMTFMVLVTFALTNLQSMLWISSDWLVSTILPAVIVELTNEERNSGLLTQLQRSSVLDQAAALKAQDMAENEYFAHNSPGGLTPWYWFSQAGYNFVHAGENLAVHFTDSNAVVEAWMNSPTHRANIMNGNYSEIGVGTAEGEFEGFKTIYVVQLFGTPAASRVNLVTTNIVEPQPEPIIAGAETEGNVLAETAAVSETVDYLPAEPELVVVEELVTTATTSATSPAEEVKVVDVVVDEERVSLYSDFVSTSTGGVPASIKPSSLTEEPVPVVAKIGRLLTKPHLMLEIIYAALAGFVFVVLLLAVFIEIKRQQPVQLLYALLLLLVMYGLLQFHLTMTGGALIV